MGLELKSRSSFQTYNVAQGFCGTYETKQDTIELE